MNAANIDVMSSLSLTNNKKTLSKVAAIGLPPSGNISTKVSHTLDQRASVSNRQLQHYCDKKSLAVSNAKNEKKSDSRLSKDSNKQKERSTDLGGTTLPPSGGSRQIDFNSMGKRVKQSIDQVHIPIITPPDSVTIGEDKQIFEM